MNCPTCQSKTLKITQSLELPSDTRNDEITLQIVQCGQCGFQALAVYRESRRGALDSESWVHEGYRVCEEDFQAVSGLMEGCPDPMDKRCRCKGHLQLGHQTDFHWDGLTTFGVEVQETFIIR